MKSKQTSMLGPIKKTFLLIILAFLAILISFACFHQKSAKKEYEDKLIINEFGKQRMYTQQISKEANYLYSLIMSLDSGETDRSEREINLTLQESKNKLLIASQGFSNTLSSMHSGYLNINSYHINIIDSIQKVSIYLEDIDSIWLKFEQSINTLVNETEDNEEMTIAANYINENNMELLNLCDTILDQVLKDSMRADKYMGYIFFGLIGLLSAITIIGLFFLMKYIILPFHKLYQGISEIGLENDTIKPNSSTSKKVTPMISEIDNAFRKINYLISLIENITNNASFSEILNFINNTFSSFIPYNYIGIALFEEDKNTLKASYGVSDGSIVGLPEKIKGATWSVNDTSLGYLIQKDEARIINDLETHTANKPLKAYNKMILEAGIKASITLPLKVSGEPIGIIFFSSNTKNVYNNEHLKVLKTLANSIAISLNQNIFINDLFYSSILALAKLAEARDEDTGEHLDRMKIYTRVITELLYKNNYYSNQITLEYIEQIERFSPLHDIGKVGIRDGILLKPAKLTSDEFDEMKRHTLYGAEVLRAAEQNVSKRGKNLFGMGIEIAEGHHEKWDGSGYPYGIKGEEIPLSARIVAIADVFDALTSQRPYKEPYPFDESLKIIEEGAGGHFDPEIVKIFIDSREIIKEVYSAFYMN